MSFKKVVHGCTVAAPMQDVKVFTDNVDYFQTIGIFTVDDFTEAVNEISNGYA